VGVPACMLGGAMRLCDSDQGRPVLRFKDGCEGGVLESVAGAHPQASPGAGGTRLRSARSRGVSKLQYMS